jgi:hypothetical protein
MDAQKLIDMVDSYAEEKSGADWQHSEGWKEDVIKAARARSEKSRAAVVEAIESFVNKGSIQIQKLERWGRSENICLRLLDRMDDGYWTPWHIASESIESLQAENARLSTEVDRLNGQSAQINSGNWQGAEYWMPLAWALCAEENGEEACNELIWEGGPIPEPWGDRWLKYEDEAKRLIALVKEHSIQ